MSEENGGPGRWTVEDLFAWARSYAAGQSRKSVTSGEPFASYIFATTGIPNERGVPEFTTLPLDVDEDAKQAYADRILLEMIEDTHAKLVAIVARAVSWTAKSTEESEVVMVFAADAHRRMFCEAAVSSTEGSRELGPWQDTDGLILGRLVEPIRLAFLSSQA